MKKIIPFLFFFSVQVQAQSTDSLKIEGLGKFKLDITTVNDFKNILKNKKYILKTVRSDDELKKYKNLNNYIIEILPAAESTPVASAYSTICKNANIFHIPKIKIGDLDFENIYFTFYNQRLSKIVFNNSLSIQAALKYQYGEPYEAKENKKLICYSDKNKTFNNDKVINVWSGGKNICSTMNDAFYNDDCELRTIYIGMIYIAGIDDIIKTCEDNEFEELKQKRKKDLNGE